MAVIFGFNLSEMSWGAFNHSRMFDRRWHLRKERFIFYQLAMLISLVAECIATYSLSKYEFHQGRVEYLSGHTAQVHNNDIIAAACVTIVFCVLVATIFGADFFFLLFWPRRKYPGWYNTTKKALAVGITLGMAASALMSTIIVARHAAFITGVDQATAQSLISVYPRPSLVYRHFGQNIAWVVLLWLAFLSTVAATAMMFISAAHDDKYGTAPKNVIDLNGEPEKVGGHHPSAARNGGVAGETESTTDETPIYRGAGGVPRDSTTTAPGTTVGGSSDEKLHAPNASREGNRPSGTGSAMV